MSAIIKVSHKDGATKYIGAIEIEVTDEDRRQTRADGIQDASLAGADEVTSFATLAEAKEHAFPSREAAQAVIDTQLPKLQNSRYQIVDFELVQ